LLIISHDVVGKKMAGTGMRYLEMARALKDVLDVTLALPAPTDLDIPGLNVAVYQETRPGSLKMLVENCDIALISGYMVEKFPFLEMTRARLVVDLYDPMVLENLHYYFGEPLEVQLSLNRHSVGIMNKLVRLGDFFLCGNERQRDFWLGVLAANGRVNPLNYRQDSSLQALVGIVGLGFPNRPPRREKPFLRGVHPQVPEEARIVLWGGGIWNWLDPLTLVQAWPQVIARHPEARLVFLGTRHPNRQVPPHEMAEKTMNLAEEIGEKDSSIIFLEWVAYDDREALLLEADVGVTLHPIHVETRYSARTRVLDYLWARLPVLITDGDITSQWVQEYGLGRVVPEADENAVAEGLNFLLARAKDSFSPAFAPLVERFAWPRVVEPLLHYCREGGYAADRQTRAPVEAAPRSTSGKLRLQQAWVLWQRQGIRALLHRVWRYIQWRFA
jgi:glycosyltransferase involved in cell wall biosynthesis